MKALQVLFIVVMVMTAYGMDDYDEFDDYEDRKGFKFGRHFGHNVRRFDLVPYERFRHGCVMTRRISKVKHQSHILERKIRKTIKVERRIKKELNLNYDDAAMATNIHDKVMIHKIIEKLQEQLQATRRTRSNLLRKLRKVVDDISGFEHDRIIRRNRLERYVDYKGVDVSRDYARMQKFVYHLGKEKVVPFAKEEAKRAAKFTFNKINEKLTAKKKTLKTLSKFEKEEVREKMQRITKRTYTKTYKALHNFILALELKGLSKGQIERAIEVKKGEIVKDNDFFFELAAQRDFRSLRRISLVRFQQGPHFPMKKQGPRVPPKKK